MSKALNALGVLILAGLASCGDGATDGRVERPNILLIVADDLGYSDIGVFGGEINTPNLDELAASGVQLTNFHTAMSCSPTRAMMLSGVDSHLVGLGNTAEVMELAAPQYMGYPGYEGYLNFRTTALPQLMRDAGYRTYMTGKWHLGLTDETSPYARGFDRTFVLLDGAAGHFDDRQVVPGTDRPKALFRRDGELAELPTDFYSSRDYARELIAFLSNDRSSDKPFFAFLSFTAPHWPLQAPEESIEKYLGQYDDGYESLFDRRLGRQQEMGLVDEDVTGQPMIPGIPSWQSLTEQQRKRSARSMEIYAAMVDDMDHYIGEVIGSLKKMGEFENTIIIFLSDNGADASTENRMPLFKRFAEQCCDNSLENLGKPNSYVFYGPGWARASSTPSKLFKSNPTQGGIRSPAIIAYPKSKTSGVRYSEFLSVLDIYSTILDFAKTDEANTGTNQDPTLRPEGRSFASVLNGELGPTHGPDYSIGWETMNRRALRMGDWKIVMNQRPFGSGEWELYDVESDPSESNDLADTHPEVFERLLDEWGAYVERNGVILPEHMTQDATGD